MTSILRATKAGLRSSGRALTLTAVGHHSRDRFEATLTRIVQ